MVTEALMRVLYITNIPSPYRVAFFGELSKKCDLTVVFEEYGEKDRRPEWYSSYRNDGGGSYQEVWLCECGDRRAGWSVLRSHLDPDRYEAIVIGVYSTPYERKAISYMKRRRIEYWINSDGGFPKEGEGVKKLIKKHYLSGAKGYFSSGGMTDAYLRYYGASTQRIHRIHFSSVLEKDVLQKLPLDQERKRLREKLGMPHDRQIILTVGQFIHRKGNDLLLHAAADETLRKCCEFYLIGDHPGEEYLRIYREKQLKHVHFVDFQPYRALAEYYQAADLFVLPTREDIWGLVVGEALANGLPVLTTDRCNAGLELLKDGRCGRIIPAEDEDSLVSGIRQMISERPDQRKERRKNCLRIGSEYTIESMARDSISALEG